MRFCELEDSCGDPEDSIQTIDCIVGVSSSALIKISFFKALDI